MFATENKTITVYSFDHLGGYKGEFEYFWAAGTGLAANSTDIKPPMVEDGYIAVFIDGNWVVKENNLGKTAYSISTKSTSIINCYGAPGEGLTLLKPASVYDSWDGTNWVDLRSDEIKAQDFIKELPALTRRQFRLIMVMSGFDLDEVRAKIETIEDPMTRQITLIEWEDATIFERTNSSVLLMANLLGLSSDHINAMWKQALTL